VFRLFRVVTVFMFAVLRCARFGTAGGFLRPGRRNLKRSRAAHGLRRQLRRHDRRHLQRRRRPGLVALRFLPHERESLAEAAHSHGVTLSEFIRRSAMRAVSGDGANGCSCR
jgi:hypothetical protein